MSGQGLFLLSRDPASKGLLASLPIMTAIGLAIRFSAGESLQDLSSQTNPGLVVFLLIVLWGALLLHAVATGFWSRSNRLTLVLPIPARTIWTFRTLAVAVAVIAPVSALTLAAGAGMDRSILFLGGKAVALLMLLVAIGQNPYPRLAKVPVNASYFVFLGLLGLLALIYLLTTPSGMIPILIPAGVALLIALQTFRAIPRGFVLAPDLPGRSAGAGWWDWLEPPEPADTEQPDDHAGAAPGYVEPELNFRQVLRRTLFRFLVNKFHVWLIGLVLVFVSGALLYEYASGEGHWLPVLYSPLWLMAHLQQSPKWIGPLAPLPIKSSLIFRYVTGGIVLPIVAGTLLGVLIIFTSQPVLVNLEKEEGTELLVPYEFWVTAEVGKPYTVVAPWGERLTLKSHIIAPGSDQAMINPFGIGEGSSERFIAWQQARAIQTVYDLDQSPDLNDPKVPEGARSELHRRTWGLGLLIISFLLIAGLVACLQQPRTRLGRFLLKAFIPALGISIGLVILAMLIGPGFGWTSREALDAAPLYVLGKVAAASGVSGISYLAASVLVLIGGWFLVGRAFARVEPDRTPDETPWQVYRS